MFVSLLSLAVAATPVNGDFEAGEVGWRDVSIATGTAARVAASDPFNTGGLVFPSGSYAMLLQGGPFSEFTPAIVASDNLLITHQTLAVQHLDEVADSVTKVRFAPVGGNATELSELPISVGVFTLQTIDISAWCGTEGSVQFAQNSLTNGSTPYTLLDDIIQQDLCPAYVDGDGDGYCPLGHDLDGDGSCVGVDEGVSSGSPGGDCDDADPLRSPEGIDLPFDGIDQDCSGGDFRPNCFADADQDGFGAVPIEGALGCTGVGESSTGDDCDDVDAAVFPGAVERCNDLDDDCDGVVDPEEAYQVWPDADEDGFGDAGSAPSEVCGALFIGALNGDDCDDGNPFISPAVTETPVDGVDQDCDGYEACYIDADQDSFGSGLTTGPLDCSGLALRGGDCDDLNDQVSPLRTERCNNVDDDCDGLLDEGFSAALYFPDGDGDGFGDALSALSAGGGPGGVFVDEGGDCDDADPTIHPGVFEIRGDGVDQDCDGFETCFVDGDGDGFGSAQLAFDPGLSCEGEGLSAVSMDCNDLDPSINPDAEEVKANGIDEDCDGWVEPATPPPQRDLAYRGGACSSGGVAPWCLLGLPLLLGRRRRRD